MERTPRMRRSAAVAFDAALQSITLLKNVNNTLPLVTEDGAPMAAAVFGVGQIRTIRGGTGSGEVNLFQETCLLDALTDSGKLVPDGILARRYRSWCLAHPNQAKSGFTGPSQNYNEEMPLEGIDLLEVRGRCEAAIMVISRVAGEGGDMIYGPGTLALTERETAMVKAVSAAFPRNVLVLNTPGYTELAEVLPGLGAVLFLGLPGQEGGGALAEVLTGTSPSGHLSDTWPLRYADCPSAGYYTDGWTKNGLVHTGMMGTEEQIDVPYREDIYVGYRYYDTFGLEVQFPFGYGLTYGAPVLASCAVGYADGQLSVTAEVENTSESYACREVVQVYISPPQGRLEQPYQKLAAYQKTGLLAPGGAQTVSIAFSLEDLASYDEKTAAYVLEAGYYDVRVGFSSRDTQVAGSLYLPRELVTRVLSNRLGTLPEGFDKLTRQGVKPWSYPGEDQELAQARSHAIRIPDRAVTTQRASYSKPFRGCAAGLADVTLYDVKNGDAKLTQLVSQMTDEELCTMVCGTGMDMSGVMGMLEGNTIMPGVEDEEDEFAEPEVFLFGEDDMAPPELLPPEPEEAPAFDPTTMTKSATFDVRGAAGQTPDFWDTYKIPHVTLADGPAGLRLTKEIKDADGELLRRQVCTAFPTGCLLACAWDPKVLHTVGQAVGEEMNEYRVDLWLAPGMNLHRNPLCGRNFEYYAEDPVLCGTCAAAMTKGVQSTGGAGVTLKHFAGNSQEFQRGCSNDIVSERAFRELYLKGFEIAVRTAAPKAVMTAYNDIHGVPAANNHDLCTAILRDEWGFQGLVMTDWGGGVSHPALSMWAGNDMIQPGGEDSIDLVRAGLGTQVPNPGSLSFAITITRPMLEQSVLRILSFILQSETFKRRCREG